jgi:hypothetical protein
MDASPAMPAVSTSPRAEVARARFTVLDETGRSPYETPSAAPRILAGAATVVAVALGAFFAVRGVGGEAKEAHTAPVVAAAPKPAAPAPKQEAKLPAPAPAGNGATPAAAAEPAAPVQPKAAAPTEIAKSAAIALPVTSKAAPAKSPRKASDNPYADPPAARSDNPY